MSYFDSGDQSFKPIPDAPFYVLAKDNFMSDWGSAKGMDNVTVTPCADLETAERVLRYTESRKELRYRRIVNTKPRNKPHVLYSLVTGWVDRSIGY